MIDAELLDRLMTMADEQAEIGYRNGFQRRGRRAAKAQRDLEALQYACIYLKGEARRHGLHNISTAPLENTYFAKFIPDLASDQKRAVGF